MDSLGSGYQLMNIPQQAWLVTLVRRAPVVTGPSRSIPPFEIETVFQLPTPDGNVPAFDPNFLNTPVPGTLSYPEEIIPPSS